MALDNPNKIELIEHYLGSEIRTALSQKDTIEVSLNSDGKLYLYKMRGERVLLSEKANQVTAKMLMNAIASWKEITLNEKSPLLSEELPTGERFSGVIPPVSAPGVCFCIRKPPARIIQLREYVSEGKLSDDHYRILLEAISQKKSIIIVGGTGSGKTTFANALLDEIAKTDDRLLIIEDLQELQCHAQDQLRLRTSPPHVEMKDLVKQSLRLTPDRIIIGEVRDAAALELLKAWNTGHPGGLATIHANSSREGISRMEQMILETMSAVPTDLIESAVDLFVYIENEGDKRFHITQISKISNNEGTWTISEI